MTYAFSWPLQRALRATLGAHAAVAEIAGDRIHDEPPHREAGGAAVDAPYVLIGEESAAAWSTATEMGAAHEIALSAVAAEPGFATVKRLAGAVCDAVLGPMALERGRIVSAQFLGARTARARRGSLRRVDMRFRILVEDDAS
jgi:hypothetical protein